MKRNRAAQGLGVLYYKAGGFAHAVVRRGDQDQIGFNQSRALNCVGVSGPNEFDGP
jgi:hypothetical protein